MRPARIMAAAGLLASTAALPSSAAASSSGVTASAGYVFSVASPHPALSVSFVGAQVSLPVRCSSNGPVAGTVVIPLANGPYSVPADDSNTYPTSNNAASSGYEGSVQMPNLCSGGPMYLYYGNGVGATFSGDLQSSDTTDPFTVQFHYRIPAASGYGNTDCSSPSQNPGSGGTAACVGVFSGSVTSLADAVSPSPATSVPDAAYPTLLPVAGAAAGALFLFARTRSRRRHRPTPAP